MQLHSIVSSSSSSSTMATIEGLTTVLIHGLDSSSQTWTKKNILNSLPTRCCIAMDQRGCGRSELGDPADFSQEALVQDIHELIWEVSSVIEDIHGAADSILTALYQLEELCPGQDDDESSEDDTEEDEED